MFKLLKENLSKTNDCIILAAPLVIFFLLIDLYLSYARTAVNNVPKLVFAIITLIVIISGFMAAWFNMAKKTLELRNKIFVYDSDRIKAIFKLVKSLPKGFGKLFFPFLFMTSFSFIVYGGILFLAHYIVSKYVGTVSPDTFNFSLSLQAIYYDLIDLQHSDLFIIDCWYIVVVILVMILSYFGILWVPEIVYEKKNAFKSLISSVKKIVLTYKSTLYLYIYIFVLLFIILTLLALLIIHPILYFMALILFYFSIIHITVLVFSYYEKSFVE